MKRPVRGDTLGGMAKYLPRILGAWAAFLLALPCAAYTPDPPPDIETLDTQEEGAATLILETIPSGADIYLDRVFIGRTPHSQTGILPGLHALAFELEGYRTRELVLDLAEKRTYTIKLALVPRTGRLSVSVTPPDARVYVDGSEIQGDFVEIPAGARSVRVYRFGYEESVRTVYVPEDGIVSAAFVLTPAPFSVSELRMRRPAFNPANPGRFGLADIRFNVTSFGRAEVEILNAAGARVALIPVPDFTESVQTVSWNGLDTAGRPLPDGVYSVELRAFPESEGGDAREPLVRRGAVAVDSSLLVFPRGLSGTASGLSLFPDPFRDPEDLLRFHGSWRPRFSPAGGFDGSILSVGAQASFGAVWEAGFQGAFDPETGESWSLGAGIKRIFPSLGSFRSAAYLGAALGTFPSGDDPAAAPTARAGLSAALGGPRAYFGAALELAVPSWDDPVPRLGARTGLAVYGGRFSAGLSAAARTAPLDGGLSLDDEVSAVLEARAFLSPLPVSVGLFLGADFGPAGVTAFRPALEISLTF